MVIVWLVVADLSFRSPNRALRASADIEFPAIENDNGTFGSLHSVRADTVVGRIVDIEVTEFRFVPDRLIDLIKRLFTNILSMFVTDAVLKEDRLSD